MKVKALIVEKDLGYTLGLEMILARVTDDVGSVSSLRDVERVYHEYRFNVLFVDIDLWRTEERTNLIKRIKAISPDVRIVLTTRDSNNVALKEAMTHGVYGCIRKPFDRTETLFMAGCYKQETKNETSKIL